MPFAKWPRYFILIQFNKYLRGVVVLNEDILRSLFKNPSFQFNKI